MGNKVVSQHQLIVAALGHIEPSGKAGNYVPKTRRSLRSWKSFCSWLCQTRYRCGLRKHSLEDRYLSVLLATLTSSKADAALALVVSHNSDYQKFNAYRNH